MNATKYHYCLTCGFRGDASEPTCNLCGTRRDIGGAVRRTGVAFLLNELQNYPISATLAPQQRARIGTHYEDEMALLVPAQRVAPAPHPAPKPQPVAPVAPAPVAGRDAAFNTGPFPQATTPATGGRFVAQAAPPRRVSEMPPAPPRPREPRPEFDWSWLAEQQANLFLFAGAFLTVVAALIYVGYSGEAVSGGLKMVLLSGYTLAFLAAGDICMRIKRVEAAGRVFFGVGSVLVPLNFVAAHTIFGGEALSAEEMWCLGSVATAAFYAAVAYAGLGRVYTFAAGIALVSAALAGSIVASVPMEWAPAGFIALAMAMSLTSVVGPQKLRERIGTIWTLQAHAVALTSAVVALAIATLAQDSELALDIATHWFLPVAMFAFAAYATLHMLVTKEIGAGIAAIAGFGAGFVAIVFATEAPYEYYAVILGVLAVTFGAAMATVSASDQQSRLPKAFDEMLRVAGIISTGAAVLVGALVLQQAKDTVAPYAMHSRWFVAGTFALLVAFYALDAFARRERLGVTGVVVATAGAAAGIVFGFDLSPEYYAVSLLAPALAFAAAARWLTGPALHRLHGEWREDVFLLGYIGSGGALAIAGAAAALGVQPVSDYEMQFRAFLPLIAIGAVAFAAIDASRGERMGIVTGALTLLLVGPAVAYVADPSAEFYAFGFVAAAIVLAVAARFTRDAHASLLHAEWRYDAFNAARLGAATAAAVGVGAVLIALDSEAGTYEPATRWFLPALAAALALFAALDASRGNRAGSVSLIATLFALAVSMPYALDASAELYAFSFSTTAIVLALAGRFVRDAHARLLHATWREDAFNAGRFGAATAAALGVGAVVVALDGEPGSYEPVTRWFLPALAASVALFAGLDASRGERIGSLSFICALVAFGLSLPYALDASAEFYAFGAVVPAVVVAAAARFAPDFRSFNLNALWREDAFDLGRVATAFGVAIATAAIVASGDPNLAYEPETRWFLPAVLGAAAAFVALDASRGKAFGTTAILYVAMAATAISVIYALEADAALYGAALAGTTIALAVAGRIWSPSWIDDRARDIVCVSGLTASWALFEGLYFADEPRIGAAVHIAAAFFYAAAAITDRSTLTLGRLLDTPQVAGVRVASGWLYAAGVTAMIGYILVLSSLPAAEEAEGGSMIMSLMAAALAFAAAGLATKFRRPEFRMHLYVMSLAVAVMSLATGPSAGTLAAVLGVYIAVFAVLALIENQPLLAVPSVVFTFAVVPVWREHADAAWWLIPAAYSSMAVAAAALAAAVSNRKQWAAGSGLVAAAFGVAAPLVGFWLLFMQTDVESGLVNGQVVRETALYQASTVSVGVLGGLVLGAAFALGRRWVIIPGTMILLAATLFQITRFDPANPQAYTAVIGAYLVLLGMFGLWKFRLAPEFEDAAPWVEALGAAIIMLPSFVQSIDGGYRYQWILLVEALAFFAVSVALKRRGLLGASISAMVLVAGRAVVDAVNALPNWIIVAIAGSSLLGIGMAILVGRDKWSEIQERLLGWWEETGNGHSAV